MTKPVHVVQKPDKPLLIFDGDCNFCCFWIRRWRRITGARVDYRPFQDPDVPRRFPELPLTRFESAVQLIEPDGRVFSGAEAVFRSLAHRRFWRGLLWLYQHLPGVALISEASYRFVARNRRFFSSLTRMVWGRSVDCRKGH